MAEVYYTMFCSTFTENTVSNWGLHQQWEWRTFSSTWEPNFMVKSWGWKSQRKRRHSCPPGSDGAASTERGTHREVRSWRSCGFILALRLGSRLHSWSYLADLSTWRRYLNAVCGGKERDCWQVTWKHETKWGFRASVWTCMAHNTCIIYRGCSARLLRTAQCKTGRSDIYGLLWYNLGDLAELNDRVQLWAEEERRHQTILLM